MSRKIVVGDRIQVIAGAHRQEQGVVRDIIRRRHRDGRPDPNRVYVVVEGVNLRSKHQRPTGGPQTQRGIIEFEAPIHISNVMVLGTDDRPTRLGMRFENEDKVRFDRRSGDVVPKPS